MTLVSAELFDLLQPLGLARTDAFRKWLDCGLKQARTSQGQNRQYKRLKAAYEKTDKTFRDKLPPGTQGNLSLRLHLADIETLHAAGSRFKDLLDLAIEAYTNEMGHTPAISSPAVVHRAGRYQPSRPTHIGHTRLVGCLHIPTR
ncbi:MAG: hypothetical protein EYC62_05915 [Alphaproteobacteria bacterium]|nr:MAG: hypothetical protein EYC62_05915 [Alphaproteobacteria bacterium]